jgi:Cu+-exporting ATPase
VFILTVDPATATQRAEYRGQTYYFCSPGCRAAFEKEPERYLQAAASAAGHHHDSEPHQQHIG